MLYKILDLGVRETAPCYIDREHYKFDFVGNGYNPYEALQNAIMDAYSIGVDIRNVINEMPASPLVCDDPDWDGEMYYVGLLI